RGRCQSRRLPICRLASARARRIEWHDQKSQAGAVSRAPDGQGTGRQPMASRNRRYRGTTVTRRTFVAAAAAGAVVSATPLRRARPAGPLKVGILLPRSGQQAQIGVDCQRGADVAPAILKAKGYPELQYVLADTETNVQVARAQAEKLINDGVHILCGA